MFIVLDACEDNNFSTKTLNFVKRCEDVKSCQSPYSDFLGTLQNGGAFVDYRKLEVFPLHAVKAYRASEGRALLILELGTK